MSETPIATYGERGTRVRVYRLVTANGTRLIRVEWREHGRKQRESWPDTREHERTAKGYAKGVQGRLAARKSGRPVPITLAALVRAYRLANTHWRPATVTNRLGRLQKFLLFAGESFPADRVTPEMVDEFRDALRKVPLTKTGAPMVANQIAAHASEVKALLRFGKLRGHLEVNPLAEYTVKLAKDEQRTETKEYTNAEWAAILAQLSPRKPQQWRAYCLIMLAGTQGPRQRALRHLRWEDVDLVARELHWRRGFDKMGKERPQPLSWDAVRVLRIARVWRRRDRYEGPWVFYAPVRGTKAAKDQPYSYQALNYQLHTAEDAAGVPRVKYRAMHGYRRTAAGNVYAATGGDLKAAGDWIGDTDLKSLQKYLKTRDPRQLEVARLVSAPAVIPAEVPNARPTTEALTMEPEGNS